MTTTTATLSVIQPANQVPGAAQGCWTYETYAAIPDDGNRYEVIDGVLYVTPAPGFGHQKAVVRTTTALTIHVDYTGLGDVLVAPFDVQLL